MKTKAIIVSGYLKPIREGQLVFDTTKPDGTPRKLMDTSKINNLGWIQSIDLKSGINKTVLEVIHGKIF